MQQGDVLENRYQIVQEIGAGGTGVIYLAYHLTLRKYVVVKKIKDNFVGSINVRGEVDILKKLHHTYLPQVYDFIQVGTTVYTVMEYIEGQDLQHYIEQGAVFSEAQLILWLRQLCQVLDYLHRQNPPILHSDIKPGNLMITPEGNICLIDFNISLDGERDDLLGASPWYAAPEQYEKALVMTGRLPYRDIHLDARMDLYSAAATFYRLAGGPLPDPSRENCPLSACEVPFSRGFCAIVDRAMAREPSHRFASARAMEKSLERTEKMDPCYRFLTKMQWLVGVLCAVVAISGALLIYYGVSINHKELWQQAWQSFHTAYVAGEDKAVIREGMALLNSHEYQPFIDDSEEREIFYAIGISYYNEKDYGKAAEYLKKAADGGKDATYLCDYAIALAKDDQITLAKKVLEENESVLQSQTALLIRAQILKADGSLDEALNFVGEVIRNGSDTGTIIRAGRLQAELYGELGQIDKEIETYEWLLDYSDSNRDRRLYGEALCQAAEAAKDEAEAERYYEKALVCYRALSEDAYSVFEDHLNLAIVELMTGQYETCRQELEQLTDSGDYRVYMLLCESYLLSGVRIDQTTADADAMREAYRKAKEAYQGQADRDMENLIDLFSDYEK